MSEVTEGELVMWSVDPGPMAGALELKLWRIATAARSYLNRMRAAELAHGVVAGERDAVTVERDELLRLSDPSWSPLCDGKAFEPMSEGLLEGWARQKSGTIQTIMAKSALHHIARAKAEAEQAQAESRRCWTSERATWIAERDDAVKRVKAAEEARDLAIVERDEAYRQV